MRQSPIKLDDISEDLQPATTEEIAHRCEVGARQKTRAYYQQILDNQLFDASRREAKMREEHRAHVRRLKRKFRRRIQILQEEKQFWQKKAIPSPGRFTRAWVRFTTGIDL